MQKNGGLSDVIRYEEELKGKMQQTQNVILQGRLDKKSLQILKGFINEEDILLKYLEVESSTLQPQVSKLYQRNVQITIKQITRFKKKIRQHKQYVTSQYGKGAIDKYHDPYAINRQIQLQQQNNRFIDQKRVMYDNQMMQNDIGKDLNRQGFYLQSNIDRNKDIRADADSASGDIKLIKKAIFKRKFMFYSLFVLLGVAVLFVVIKRIFFPKL